MKRLRYGQSTGNKVSPDAKHCCYRKYLLFLNCNGHVSPLKLVLLAEVSPLTHENGLKVKLMFRIAVFRTMIYLLTYLLTYLLCWLARLELLRERIYIQTVWDSCLSDLKVGLLFSLNSNISFPCISTLHLFCNLELNR